MKLKLDLHPIYNDTQKIEAALLAIIDEAVAKRATEVEIIPGKGSGALKKTVLRFLDRPEIKTRYHRIDKDSDNFGRLFVYFRPPSAFDTRPTPTSTMAKAGYVCFCCQATVSIEVDKDELAEAGSKSEVRNCPSCGSPNRLTLRVLRRGDVKIDAESGYE